MKVKTAVRAGQDAISCWDFRTDGTHRFGDMDFGYCLNACEWTVPFEHDEDELDCFEFCNSVAEKADWSYNEILDWCPPACAAYNFYID